MLDAAESGRDFEYVPVFTDRRNFQHVGNDELGGSVFGVLVEQFVEDLAGLGAKLIEEIRPFRPQALRPFAPCAEGSVERQVTDQVEGVGVGLVGGLGQMVEVDSAFGQTVDDFATPLWVGPFAAQFGGVAVQRADLVRRVIGELDDAELRTVGVEFVDKVGRDFHLAAIEVELLSSTWGINIRR